MELKLFIQRKEMTVPIRANFRRIPNDHPMERIVAPLIAAHNHVQERMHGTAFVIAPELALTAQHVVADYLETIDREPVTQRLEEGGRHHGKMKFFMFMLVSLPDGRRVPLTVVKAYMSHPGDVTLLRVSKPNDVDWKDLAPYPTLRLVPPTVGANISALGYPDSSTKRRVDGVVELHTWPRLASGRVQEVHDHRRDSHLLPYPCFQVNARFHHGMSGGPVLDADGRVCGLISKSFDLLDDEEPIGYASSLWPACRIALPDITALGNDHRRLFDLMAKGRVMTSDISDVSAGIAEDGRFCVFIKSSSANNGDA